MPQQESKCPVNATRVRLHEFYYSNDPKTMMCSKCHPCKLGIFDAIKIFEAIQAGKGRDKDIVQLKRIASDVKDGGMCKKGKDHADILAAFLAANAADLDRHINGVCTYHECNQLVRYEIDPKLCTMCDTCREVCPSFAVEGQKMVPGKTGFTPYRIRQRRCTHCGECIKEPVRSLVCTCDVSGKVTGKETACSIHDMAGAGK
jgi:ferredoxin